jgi:hypothetical protein
LYGERRGCATEEDTVFSVNPPVEACFEQVQEARLVSGDLITKGENAELVAKRRFAARAQFKDFEFADLDWTWTSEATTGAASTPIRAAHPNVAVVRNDGLTEGRLRLHQVPNP